MRANPFLLLLPALAFAVSCGSVQRTDGSAEAPPPPVTVEVSNLKQVDFNLYMQTGTHRIRLGTVPAMTTRFFTIPPHVIGERNMVRFEFDVIGSGERSFSQDPVPVNAGDRLSLSIQ